MKNISIKSKCSGLVLDIAKRGGAGSKILQFRFHGRPNQLWNIEYDQSDGLQSVFFSVLHPDCVLDVRGEGGGASLFLAKYQKGKVSQLWRYKNNILGNQATVLDVPKRSLEPCHLGTWKHHGGNNQIFYLEQN